MFGEIRSKILDYRIGWGIYGDASQTVIDIHNTQTEVLIQNFLCDVNNRLIDIGFDKGTASLIVRAVLSGIKDPKEMCLNNFLDKIEELISGQIPRVYTFVVW